MKGQKIIIIFTKWPGADPVFEKAYCEESFKHWCQQNNYTDKEDPELNKKHIVYESTIE